MPERDMQQEIARVAARRAQASELIPVLARVLKLHYAELALSGGTLRECERKYIKLLQPAAEQMQKNVDEQMMSQADLKPIDARCFVGISEDKMLAWAWTTPAAFGGSALTEQSISDALQKAGVVFGIETDAIKELLVPENCGKLLTVARGVAAIDGVNGQIIEHFEREKKAIYTASETERADYKNLNIFQQIQEGQKICTVVPATPGTEGRTVTGLEVAPKPGNPPFVPIGKNTELNEDQTALIAKCDGQIRYANQAFQVEQVLTINGDVDNTTGNIDAIGTVEISGNVMDGFVVKATGDIHIKGTVDGGSLYAGKDIRIMTGVKGSVSGSITAQGDIRCKYIENCMMHAGGSVTADMVLNSTVLSNGSIVVKTGRGIIIGGNIAARESIVAKVIGNESSRKITLSVGSDPDYGIKLKSLTEELQKTRRNIEETQKNVNYLESMKDRLDEKYQQLLTELNLRLTVAKVQQIKLDKDLMKLHNEQKPEGSYIAATKIYPPAKVNIGNLSYSIEEEKSMCRIYSADGEIMIGSK